MALMTGLVSFNLAPISAASPALNLAPNRPSTTVLPSLAATADDFAQAVAPAVTSDLKQISFATPAGLFLIQPTGGERQPLTSRPEALFNSLVWSDDGQQLALVQNYTDVYRVDPKDNRSTQVFSSQCQRPPSLELIWQSDHKTLLIKQQCPASTADGQSQTALFLVDATGQLTALPPLPNAIESDVYVSPDGLQMVYVANQQIYVAGVNGAAAPRQITQVEGLYAAAGSPLAWSPDGQQLAFYEGAYPFQQINLVNVDGTNRRLLTPDENFQIYRSRLLWSPDGRYIAFYLPHNPPFSNQEVVALINVNTGEIQPYTRPGFYNALSWAPDSQSLVLGAGSQLDQQALFLLNIATQAFTALTTQPLQSILESQWSSEGDWIAFTATPVGDDLGTQVLHVVRPDATQFSTLTTPNEYVFPFAWMLAP